MEQLSKISHIASQGDSATADRFGLRVLSVVADANTVAFGMLLHKSRCKARVAASRQLAMYLMHVVLGRTLTDVGAFFGRDRTTVAHACGKIEDERDDPEFDAFVTRLEDKIGLTTSSPARRDQVGGFHFGAN